MSTNGIRGRSWLATEDGISGFRWARPLDDALAISPRIVTASYPSDLRDRPATSRPDGRAGGRLEI